MRYVLLALLIAVGVFVAGLWRGWALWPWRDVPRQYNPFAPLHISDAPTLITQWKLKQLGSDPTACHAVLEQARDAGEIDYRSVGDTTIGACPLRDVVRVQSTSVQFGSGFLASCPMAVAWTIFEQHRLQPAARALFGEPVTRVDHYGSFACRNIYHRDNARRSEHATAEAFDVAGFRLGDGTRISVLSHWDDAGRKGTFLHRVFEGACAVFGNALGPEYNAAHANHFHLGMRGFNLCR